METKDLYLFKNPSLIAPDLNLDIEDGIFTLRLDKWTYHPLKVVIDTNVLAVNTTTCAAYCKQKNEFYTLYNYRELVRALNETSMRFWNQVGCINYIQIDKKPDNSLFTKVFISSNQKYLKSNTHNFKDQECFFPTPENIHSLDKKYQHIWNFESIRKDEDIVRVSVFLQKRYQEPVYLCHGGDIQEIYEGTNIIIFKHVPTANIQVVVGDKKFTNWKYSISEG